VIDTLPIKGGRSSLHKALAISLILSVVLIILALGTTPAKAANSGDLLYVCNGNNVTVLYATNLTVERIMSFGNDVVPGYIALSPGGTTAYIISVADNRLLVVDIASSTITHITTMASPPGKPPAVGSGITVSSDGKRIYVTDNQAGLVRVINAVNYTVVANISVGSYPIGLTISPDDRYAYVANSGSGTISVIDTFKNMVIGNYSGGNGTFDVQLSPDGRWLYVSNWYGGDVRVCDAFTGVQNNNSIQVNPWIDTGRGGINNMRVSPDGKTLYVANAYDNTIVLINTVTQRIDKTIPVGQYPREMELGSNGTQLIVSLIGDQKVCAISLPAGNVTYRDMSPATPLGIAYYSSAILPTPRPLANVTATPAPTPTFAPTATPTPAPTGTATEVPTITPQPPLYYMGTKVTPKPTPAPAGTVAPESSSRPYFTGWQSPVLNISSDNLVLLAVTGLIVFLLVIGIIGYIGVRRNLRNPDDEDEDEE
jgi:YVTN family beta-propeller protein